MNESAARAQPGSKRALWYGGLVALALIVLLALARGRHATAEKGAKGDTASAAPDAGDKGGDSKGDVAKSTDPVAVQVAPAMLGPVTTTVMAQGTLAAGQGGIARVAVTTAGRLRQVLVREGDHVTAGQLVAQVDNRSQVAQAHSALAALNAAQAQTRGAQLTSRAAAVDQVNTLANSRLAVQAAQLDRDNAVKQAQLALQSAVSDLQKVQRETGTQGAVNSVHAAQLALRAARLDRAAAVQQAQNALDQARTDEAKLRAGARPQEIVQADQAIQQATATRDRAATEVQRVQFLFDKGIRARRELDDATTTLKVAEAGLATARNAANLVRAGARPEDLQAASLKTQSATDLVRQTGQSNDAKIAQAQAALRAAELSAQQTRGQRPTDLHSAELKVKAAREALAQAQNTGAAKLHQARSGARQAEGTLQVAAKAQDAQAAQAATAQKSADLAAAQTQVAFGDLRAPLSGIVTRRALNAGDMADPAVPILEITDPTALNLLANLPAEMGAGVRAGMVAHVTTDAAPGRVFPASVTSVGSVDPQTNLLAVRIAVSGGANANTGLRPGMFATAQIVTQTNPLAILVPRQAVLTRDGKPAVMTVGGDNKAHEKPVVTGAPQGAKVQIISGLKPGERVIVMGQYELDEGAKVEVGGAAEKKGK